MYQTVKNIVVKAIVVLRFAKISSLLFHKGMSDHGDDVINIFGQFNRKSNRDCKVSTFIAQRFWVTRWITA